MNEPNNESKLVRVFLTACKPARLVRNNLLGHDDLTTTTKPWDSPIPEIFLKRIYKLGQFAKRLLITVLIFPPVGMYIGEADVQRADPRSEYSYTPSVLPFLALQTYRDSRE
jgi:hypothetical protein